MKERYMILKSLLSNENIANPWDYIAQILLETLKVLIINSYPKYLIMILIPK